MKHFLLLFTTTSAKLYLIDMVSYALPLLSKQKSIFSGGRREHISVVMTPFSMAYVYQKTSVVNKGNGQFFREIMQEKSDSLFEVDSFFKCCSISSFLASPILTLSFALPRAVKRLKTTYLAAGRT